MSFLVAFNPLSATALQWETFLQLYGRLSSEPISSQKIIALHERRKDLYVTLDEVILCGYPKASVSGETVWQIEIIQDWKAFNPTQVKAVREGVSLMLPAESSFVCSAASGSLTEEILLGLGATRVNALNYYRLQKRDFLKSFAEAPSTDLMLKVFEFVPERYYKAFAELMTVSMNDIVRDTSWELFKETEDGLVLKMNEFKASGSTMVVGLLLTPSGALVGQSVIEVRPNEPLANQHITGIVSSYRGKGWARFIKASLSQEVFNRYAWVDNLETNCNEANKAIIRLNLDMGYQLWETRYQYWGQLIEA